jgi:hypothetical protein
MKQPLIDVKSLFENNIQEIQNERQNEVKSRIESFFNRHRIGNASKETSHQNDGKIRPLWGKS